MIKYLKSLTKFNAMKIDVAKGIRQGILMFLPLMIGYLVGYFSIGLLISTGTLAHIYVFGGTAKSKLRTVFLTSIVFAIAMMLGTLTVNQPVIFGILLLIVAVVPYYVFSSLNIPGPSSTFFIVAFSLPINLPVAPEEAVTRGIAVFIGGLLATLVVIIVILLSKESAEVKSIKNDYNIIKQLVYNFDDPKAFAKVSQFAVTAFRNTDNQLITASSAKSQKSPEFQRLILLHNIAQGIHSELLELNEENARPLPKEIRAMADYVINLVFTHGQTNKTWTQQVDIEETYEKLVDNIFKVDAIMNADEKRLEHEVDIRVPIYGHRLVNNLTIDSFVFRNTLRYSVIMAIAIFIALMFDFDKAYWIPLSTHTVLLGSTTLHSFERAGSRGIGTIIGVLALSLILLSMPPVPVAIILLAVAAGITEIFVGANYSFAVIFITIQVILLNGLASNHLSILIALPRIIDVIVGILIAVVCLLVIGRKTASSMLPGTLAKVARNEAVLFHYLFSSNKYSSRERDKKEMLHLSVQLNNMKQIYSSANGEVFSNKMVIQYYYPSIYALEEISFMLTRALSNEQRYHIDDETMGQYLLVFENIAKHFEIGSNINVEELTTLPQYMYIRTSLMSIQSNCKNARQEVKLSYA
ncbi:MULTISPECIES: FUSC family protein [Staphylococcus]|uniref:FUSC family protein n=1 Tax=Staphylococcus nepalensis TaxID=214473 RepID=A0ABS3KZM4_9STAP|nr:MULTISPECIES: FUSC family protein [Staphylococcus]MBO1212595.1 FUSC family protein [Staphylococcus nepalensis]MBO1215961.1 FUSC family protein [Staphylococcus nepalensis]MBO1226228.1 FUSC family protein [Staphylococcus nepalensis]MBO1235030.1 FUSC family protein [Staphylococcus nepalensis]MBO1236279.1 FUSC family protein [Staphylococcus nepalensis]